MTGEQMDSTRETETTQNITDCVTSDVVCVGTLSDVIGETEAHQFISEVQDTRRYLAEKALERWGLPDPRSRC